MTLHLAKLVCQLGTLEHVTELERLIADQHGVQLRHDEMLLVDVVGRILRTSTTIGRSGLG